MIKTGLMVGSVFTLCGFSLANLVGDAKSIHDLGYGAFLTLICIVLVIGYAKKDKSKDAASRVHHEELERNMDKLMNMAERMTETMERNNERAVQIHEQMLKSNEVLGRITEAVRHSTGTGSAP